MFNLVPKEFTLIFFTKFIRNFSFAMLALIFIRSLDDVNQPIKFTFFLQSYSVLGDVFLTIFLLFIAIKWNPKNILMISTFLKVIGGLILFQKFYDLTIVRRVCFLCIVNPTNFEMGVFEIMQKSIIQAKKSSNNSFQLIQKFYQTVGYFGQAFGALITGFIISIYGEKFILLGYSAIAIIMAICYLFVDNNDIFNLSELFDNIKWKNIRGQIYNLLGLGAIFLAQGITLGLVTQSFISFYMKQIFGQSFISIGYSFFLFNLYIIGGRMISKVITKKFGANYQIFIFHLPSNLLLILIALLNDISYQLFITLISIKFIFLPSDETCKQEIIDKLTNQNIKSSIVILKKIFRGFGFMIGLYIFSQVVQTKLYKSLNYDNSFLYLGIFSSVFDAIIILFNYTITKYRENLNQFSKIQEKPMQAQEFTEKSAEIQ